MISYPATIHNVATRILAAGSQGPAIVFVHGFGAKADRWRLNLDAAAQAGYRAFAFDLPGHGFADKGEGVPCTVPEFSRFLGAVMDHLDLEKAVIVGTSLGGAVVARFAAHHAERVEALVFVGSMGLVPMGEEIRARIHAGAANQSHEAMANKFKFVISNQALVTQDMVDEEFRVNNSQGAHLSLANTGRYIGADLDGDVCGPAIAALGKRTLLVWGDEDKVVPLAFGKASRALLADSRLAILQGTSHTPYFERAGEFNALLASFLQGQALPALPGVEIV